MIDLLSSGFTSTLREGNSTKNKYQARADGHSQNVLATVAKARTLRKVEETKEELTRITQRISSTLASYEIENAENNRILKDSNNNNMEFVKDPEELLILLSDSVKKKRYQQQVTVFVVGFERACDDRIKLLHQINEFFQEHSTIPILQDGQDSPRPDIDLEEVSTRIADALTSANAAAERLLTINHDMINHLAIQNTKESKRSKKKLEKSLAQTRDDLISLTTRLDDTQIKVQEKEKKIKELTLVTDAKDKEIKKLTIMNDTLKRDATAVDDLREQNEVKTMALQKARQQIEDMKAASKAEEAAEKFLEKRRLKVRLSSQASMDGISTQMTSPNQDRQTTIRDRQILIDEVKEKTKKDLETKHQRTIEELKKEYSQELKKVQDEHSKKLHESIATQAPSPEKHSTPRKDSEPERTRRWITPSPEMDARSESPSMNDPNRLSPEPSSHRRRKSSFNRKNSAASSTTRSRKLSRTKSMAKITKSTVKKIKDGDGGSGSVADSRRSSLATGIVIDTNIDPKSRGSQADTGSVVELAHKLKGIGNKESKGKEETGQQEQAQVGDTGDKKNVSEEKSVEAKELPQINRRQSQLESILSDLLQNKDKSKKKGGKGPDGSLKGKKSKKNRRNNSKSHNSSSNSSSPNTSPTPSQPRSNFFRRATSESDLDLVSEIDEEEAEWDDINPEELPEKFKEYRTMSVSKRKDALKKMEAMKQRYQKQIVALKAQNLNDRTKYGKEKHDLEEKLKKSVEMLSKADQLAGNEVQKLEERLQLREKWRATVSDMLYENNPGSTNIDDIINQGSSILSPEHSSRATPHRSAGSNATASDLPSIPPGSARSPPVGKQEVTVKGAGEFPKVESLVALQQEKATEAIISNQTGFATQMAGIQPIASMSTFVPGINATNFQTAGNGNANSMTKQALEYFQFPKPSGELQDDTVAKYSTYSAKDIESIPADVQLTASQILREALRQIPSNVPNETAVKLVSQMTSIPVEVAVQILVQNSSVLQSRPPSIPQQAEAQKNTSQTQNSQVIHTSDLPNHAMKISNRFGQLTMADRGIIGDARTQLAAPSQSNDPDKINQINNMTLTGDNSKLLENIGRIRAFELNQSVGGNASALGQATNSQQAKQNVALRDVNLQFARYIEGMSNKYALAQASNQGQASTDVFPDDYPRNIDVAQLSRELPPLQRSPRKPSSSSSHRRFDSNSRRSPQEHRRAATADSPGRYGTNNRMNQILVDPTTGLPLETPYGGILDRSNMPYDGAADKLRKNDPGRPSSVQKNRVASAGKPVTAVAFDSSAGQGSLPSRASGTEDSTTGKPLETFSIGEFNLPEYKLPSYEHYVPQYTEIDYNVSTNLNLDNKTYSGITSVPTRQISPLLSEHPAVDELLKSYQFVIKFKDSLSGYLNDQDFYSAAQSLRDIQPVQFSKDERIGEQVTVIRCHVELVLSQIQQIIVDNLVSTLSTLKQKAMEPPILVPQIPEKADESELRELAEKLQNELLNQFDLRQKELNASSTTISEMQRVITQLKAEIRNSELPPRAITPKEARAIIENRKSSTLSLSPRTSPSDHKEAPTTSASPIMFTRKDAERNAKSLKRALNIGSLSENAYKESMKGMDNYTSLPGKLLACLVNKYTHHCQMKNLEGTLRRKKELDDNTLFLLSKMEKFQSKRASKWSEKIEIMTSQRLQLAELLTSTFDSIEQNNSIFLIKPAFTYKSKLKRFVAEKISDNIAKTNYETDPPVAIMGARSLPGGSRNAVANMPFVTSQLNIPVDSQNASTLTSKSGTWQASSSLVTSDDLSTVVSSVPKLLEMDIKRSTYDTIGVKEEISEQRNENGQRRSNLAKSPAAPLIHGYHLNRSQVLPAVGMEKSAQNNTRDIVDSLPTIIKNRPSITSSINERISTGTSVNAPHTAGTTTASQSIDYTMTEESSEEEEDNELIHSAT
ncbi:hypothetical protein TrispH2_007875 [Trichoplax sp. H2]|nr:hypothetical protein TrispH2_007875 [Trichoplax sp. H2]|eukprot:RDD40822.1 hypothetical protein TrispH2_007875 [Trichoplax sp. H2]